MQYRQSIYLLFVHALLSPTHEQLYDWNHFEFVHNDALLIHTLHSYTNFSNCYSSTSNPILY